MVALHQKGNIQDVIDAIQEAESLVAERKRKIKIADESKAGWTTIQHMDKAGSTQEVVRRKKRVQIAEEAALKEIDNKKRQRRSINSNFYD